MWKMLPLSELSCTLCEGVLFRTFQCVSLRKMHCWKFYIFPRYHAHIDDILKKIPSKMYGPSAVHGICPIFRTARFALLQVRLLYLLTFQSCIYKDIKHICRSSIQVLLLVLRSGFMFPIYFGPSILVRSHPKSIIIDP